MKKDKNTKSIKNVENTKNLNNIDNAVMHKLDAEDRETIDNILVKLDVMDSFIQIITDYVDFQEFDKGKDAIENSLLTYYDIKSNKQNLLTLLYESKGKIDEVKKTLQDLIDK